jgi:hypothetical protein
MKTRPEVLSKQKNGATLVRTALITAKGQFLFLITAQYGYILCRCTLPLSKLEQARHVA